MIFLAVLLGACTPSANEHREAAVMRKAAELFPGLETGYVSDYTKAVRPSDTRSGPIQSKIWEFDRRYADGHGAVTITLEQLIKQAFPLSTMDSKQFGGRPFVTNLTKERLEASYGVSLLPEFDVGRYLQLASEGSLVSSPPLFKEGRLLSSYQETSAFDLGLNLIAHVPGLWDRNPAHLPPPSPRQTGLFFYRGFSGGPLYYLDLEHGDAAVLGDFVDEVSGRLFFSNQDELYQLDPGTDQWERLESMPEGMIWGQGRYRYVIEGRWDPTGTRPSVDVFRLDLSTRQSSLLLTLEGDFLFRSIALDHDELRVFGSGFAASIDLPSRSVNYSIVNGFAFDDSNAVVVFDMGSFLYVGSENFDTQKP